MVLVCRYELRLPGCRSLKDKRSRLRPVVDRIRHRHHVSVGEVAHQDVHDRAALELAVVATGPVRAERLMDGLDRLVWSADGIEVLGAERRWLD